jgi:hypothetical protein
VWVPFNDEVCCQIIRMAGFDPHNLDQYGNPADGWKYDGQSRPPGFKRRVIIAYQHLHHPRVRRVYLTRGGKRGFWALSPEGVEAVQRLLKNPRERRRVAQDKQNMTARFIDQRIRETKGGLLQTLHKAVATNMPVSAAAGIVEDHVQNTFTRLIARDALRSRILMGLPIKDHHLASWAIRGAYTDARNDGTEPVAREFLGARTESERARGKILGDVSDPRLIWGGEETETTAPCWTDIADTDSSMSAVATEERILFDQIWHNVEHTIRTRTSAGERGLQAMRMRAEGYSLQEIADAGNLARGRTTNLLDEVRRSAHELLAEKI